MPTCGACGWLTLMPSTSSPTIAPADAKVHEGWVESTSKSAEAKAYGAFGAGGRAKDAKMLTFALCPSTSTCEEALTESLQSCASAAPAAVNATTPAASKFAGELGRAERESEHMGISFRGLAAGR